MTSNREAVGQCASEAMVDEISVPAPEPSAFIELQASFGIAKERPVTIWRKPHASARCRVPFNPGSSLEEALKNARDAFDVTRVLVHKEMWALFIPLYKKAFKEE